MQIHYFQRYHSKENVDTANTMLMLSRLYNYNADRFFSMLNSLMLGGDEAPQIAFDLQAVGHESVPDAIISQKSLKIIVETKLNNRFRKDQLLRHLGQFAGEKIKVLLTLDPRPMKKEFLGEFATALGAFNAEHAQTLRSPIKHVNLTFEQLLDAMREAIDERDIDIAAVLEDFSKYCFDEELIPDSHKWMRAIAAGTTLRDNVELRLYYDDASRGYSEHGYIGLYSRKSVRAVGKVVKMVVSVAENNKLSYRTESGDTVTEQEVKRIKEAEERAKEYGYDLIGVPHRYFLVDEFFETDFRKSSKNPIQRAKFFPLARMLGYKEMPSTEQIARDLDGRTWEEFGL